MVLPAIAALLLLISAGEGSAQSSPLGILAQNNSGDPPPATDAGEAGEHSPSGSAQDEVIQPGQQGEVEPTLPANEAGSRSQAPDPTAEEPDAAAAGSETESSDDTAGPAPTPPDDPVAQVKPAPVTSPDSDDDGTGIRRSPDGMPEPVRKTWRSLVAAARSGDIDQLRPIIASQPQSPTFAFTDIGDPIEYLKSLSGDPAGREILAILLEILEIGYIRADEGTDEEIYIWPYFARYPLARLTPEETVEMFTILTAGDYQDMLSYGAYIFFRVGIGPDGTWHFFLAGD